MQIKFSLQDNFLSVYVIGSQPECQIVKKSCHELKKGWETLAYVLQTAIIPRLVKLQ
jgi:hypothetical protein